jgi:hypothetical protein
MLALTRLRESSREEEEFESSRLDVWLVLMLVLTRLSELSIDEEETESSRLEV